MPPLLEARRHRRDPSLQSEFRAAESAGPLPYAQCRESELLQAPRVQRNDGIYLRSLLIVRLNAVEIEADQLFRRQCPGVYGTVDIGHGCRLKIERGAGLGWPALGQAVCRDQKVECTNCDCGERTVKLNASHHNLLGCKEREAKTSELARNVTGDHSLVIEALVK